MSIEKSRMTVNDKIIAIHQPNYIPWLGYFYKIYQADIFVFLDDAQFSNEGMHNYTYIKTPNGQYRLKYPVNQRLGDRINEVHSRDELNWKAKHLATIEANYKRAPYYNEVIKIYKEILLNDYNNISILNIELIKSFVSHLKINTQFIISSDLKINFLKEEKVIKICKSLNGNIYYSGTGAKTYQKDENFNNVGIELRYSLFKPFHYPQLWEGFQSNVSALDYFMNCGFDWERILHNQN
jgi:hypothetical protein